MRVLLDTTYLLPTIGVAVKQATGETVSKLLDRGDELFVSEISIFELSAKGAQYVNLGKLSPERVERGIRSILHDESITKLPSHDSSILFLSFNLRGFLNDFIDCLILSSAMNNCEALVTEDASILSLKRQKKLEELVTTSQSKCEILRLTDFLLSQ